MTENPVLVETIDDHIGLVTFNRPAKLNALSYDVVRLLDEALTKFEDDPEIRCIVITGAGEKAFSSGADIHEQVEISPEELQERLERRAQWLWHLANAAEADDRRDQRPGLRRCAPRSPPHLISGSAVSVPASASSARPTAGSTPPGRCRCWSAGRQPRSCYSPRGSSRPRRRCSWGCSTKSSRPESCEQPRIQMAEPDRGQ